MEPVWKTTGIGNFTYCNFFPVTSCFPQPAIFPGLPGFFQLLASRYLTYLGSDVTSMR